MIDLGPDGGAEGGRLGAEGTPEAEAGPIGLNIFDRPLKVAQSVVGFEHDEDCPAMAGTDFEVLKRTAAKRSFFERLLAK